MIHKGGVTSLTWLEGKEIIADDTLQPGDSVIAGD
jgi:hypothetical protein